MTQRIPQTFIDELLTRADIVEVIDRHVSLKKTGSNYSACCPFHAEKTPSFTVSAPKQFYYCFGCGAHGNVLGFLMAYERLEFVPAVEELARYLGLPVPREMDDHAGSQQALYDLLEKAAHYYQTQLDSHPEVKAYLSKRGLTKKICQRFGIGVAPSGWDNLSHYLQATDSIQEQLLQAGLLVRSEKNKRYDRFRQRIMIPIRDQRGRVIGFGGRSLGDELPKYLNSPETPLFHKGSELYALYEAKQSNRHTLPFLLVVEGYMDAIALHQYGIPETVATLGTATTARHLQRMFRCTSEVIFCFDGDRAGKEAAWRALEVCLPLLQDGWQIRFMFLPEGEDPDSWIRKIGAETFRQKITEALSLVDYFFQHLSAQTEMDTIAGKAKLASLAKPLLQKIRPGVFAQLMLDKLATLVGMSSVNLMTVTELTPTSDLITAKPMIDQGESLKFKPITLAITLLLQYPELAQKIRLTAPLQNLPLPGMATFYQLLDLLQGSPQLNTGNLLEHWRESKIAGRLAELAASPLLVPAEGAEAELLGVLDKIATLHREQQIQQLMAKASSAELSADEKVHLLNLLKERHWIND